MGDMAQQGVSPDKFRSISTPDVVESRLGRPEFRDGAPSEATAELLYEHLDFVHGVEAFLGSFPGASVEAIHQGFLSIGVEDRSLPRHRGPTLTKARIRHKRPAFPLLLLRLRFGPNIPTRCRRRPEPT